MNVFFVDDEPAVVISVTEFLQGEGFVVRTSPSICDAVRIMSGDVETDLAIFDMLFPGAPNGGLDLIREWAMRRPDAPCIVQTAHGYLDRVPECLNLGASNYITKDGEMDLLASVLMVAAKKRVQAVRNLLSQRFSEWALQNECAHLLGDGEAPANASGKSADERLVHYFHVICKRMELPSLPSGASGTLALGLLLPLSDDGILAECSVKVVTAGEQELERKVRTDLQALPDIQPLLAYLMDPGGASELRANCSSKGMWGRIELQANAALSGPDCERLRDLLLGRQAPQTDIEIGLVLWALELTALGAVAKVQIDPGANTTTVILQAPLVP
ncbi:MAG: response regulator [Phycisphaerae bacterium]|jgi:DNA-binding NarL/FixJ family response regulator|nr:response regulator [Phycisphaerae bacterium]